MSEPFLTQNPLVIGFCRRLKLYEGYTYRRVIYKIAHHVNNQVVIPDDAEKTPERFGSVSIDKNLQKEYPPI